MNIKKNGKALNKMGLIWNGLLEKIGKFHFPFSIKSTNSYDTGAYVFDENTRKSILTARLEAEGWRAYADKLKRGMS